MGDQYFLLERKGFKHFSVMVMDAHWTKLLNNDQLWLKARSYEVDDNVHGTITIILIQTSIEKVHEEVSIFSTYSNSNAWFCLALMYTK